jgi:hypothetical protein
MRIYKTGHIVERKIVEVEGSDEAKPFLASTPAQPCTFNAAKL